MSKNEKELNEACESCIFRKPTGELSALEAYFKDNRWSNQMRRVEMLAKFARKLQNGKSAEKDDYLDMMLAIIAEMYNDLHIIKKDIDFNHDTK